MRALLLVTLLGLSARASPSGPVALTYDASGTPCPPKDELVKAVTRRVGLNPFSQDASDRVLVQVSRAADGSLRATLSRFTSGSETGRRELTSQGASCRELFQALELAVALAVDSPPPATLAPSAPPAPSAAPEPPALVPWRQSSGPSDTPVARMTRTALVAEQLRLESTRPLDGTRFILFGAGGVVAGVGLHVLNVVYQGQLGGSGTPSWVAPAVGSALLVAGVASLVFGWVQRWLHGDTRTLFDARLAALSDQLTLLEASGAMDPGPPVPRPRAQGPLTAR